MSVQPTFFEVTTAVALDFFAAQGVEVGVIEVGLGGRLDATNIITPSATAITSIAFDHEKYLGQSLSAIAGEKAGIIKPGVPVVVGELPPEAAAVVERVAREREAPAVRAADGVTLERIESAPGSMTRIRLRTPARDYGELRIALRGAHQIGNALVAIRLLELLDDQGTRVPKGAVAAGLSQASWPGRLEHRHLSPTCEMILDAAHNPAGAAVLAAYLDTFGTKAPLVFAAMRDKNTARMFDALLPSVSSLIVTRASNRRSADPEQLATQAASTAPGLPIMVRPSVPDALRTAWALAPRIVVAGSIFLLGDVMKEAGQP